LTGEGWGGGVVADDSPSEFCFQREYLDRLLGPWGPSGRGDDGIFGSVTNSNVRSYQGAHRDIYNRALAVDGIVGPLTWGALGGAAVGVALGASQPSSGNNSGSSSPSSGAGSESGTDDSGSGAIYGPPAPNLVDITNSFYTLLRKNARIAHHHRRNILWFLGKVGYHGAPWDYKQILGPSTQYIFLGRNVNGDDLGNVHYGYVGTAAAFGPVSLLGGGGFKNVIDHGPEEIRKYWGSYFDQPRDVDMTKWGIDLYHQDFKDPWWLIYTP